MKIYNIDEKWVDGVSDGLVLPCQICGKENIKFDYKVKDELWDRIIPEKYKKGVICLECLEKICNKKGVDLPTSLLNVQYTGEGFTIDLLPEVIYYYEK